METFEFEFDVDPRLLNQTAELKQFLALSTRTWTDVWVQEPMTPGMACRIQSAWLQAPVEWPSFEDGYSHPGIEVWPNGFRPQLLDIGSGEFLLGTSNAPAISPLMLRDEFEEGWIEPRWFVPEELRLTYALRTDDGLTYAEKVEDGSSREVIRILPASVSMRTDLITRYAAAKQMDVVFSLVSDLNFPDGEGVEFQEKELFGDDFYAALYLGSRVSHACRSRLVGLKRIRPSPIQRCGVYPFERPREFEEFAVGEDVSGEPIMVSCDPDTLSDPYFSDPAPKYHTLTPVHFDREVLRKYRDTPARYGIGQCDISCHGLWTLRSVDMNHEDRVVTYLGDLSSLPASEQLHWKSNNIFPDGVSISEPQFRRDFLAQFAANTAWDLVVRRAIPRLNAVWESRFGWPLFRPPNPGDAHLIDQIGLPVQEDMSEFDRQVMVLAKVVVGDLNEAEFGSSKDGGLNKFDDFLGREGFSDPQSALEVLRRLQGLRSFGAAHRKSSDYFEKSGVEGFVESFRDLLQGVAQTLELLEQFALNDN